MINYQRNFVTLHQKYSDMKLERVVINKFWGKYNLDLHLDPDVNILTGANGSGKTTILDIVITLLANYTEEYCQQLYDNAILYLSGNTVIKSITEDNGKKKNLFYVNGSETNYQDISEELQFESVATFDTPMMPVEAIKKMKESYTWLRSELDFRLKENQDEYNRLQATLLNRVKQLMEGENPDIKEMRELTSILNDFKEIANEMFAPKKQFNEEKGEVFFTLLDDNKKKITLDKLSSGEKQLLILLFSTVAWNKGECLIFWDEPEISLHIEWQRKLIRVIRQLNPNMQLIIATHSPSILFEGWENRVLNIEELLEQ